MNIDLKKINWEPGKAASQLQVMTLRIRKKRDEDEESSYITITEDLQVHKDGTILNPPLIKGLDEETDYVFRLINNDPDGGQFDMVYTTPGTFAISTPIPPYYSNSELIYKEAGGLRAAMLPSPQGAYFGFENDLKDWFGNYSGMMAFGNPVWEKKSDKVGFRLPQGSSMNFTVDSTLLNSLATQYAFGIHFYVAEEELPATGTWRLINYGLPPIIDGITVYVNCATRKVHWRQYRQAAFDEIISVAPIRTNAWNQLLVIRQSTGGTRMWLNSVNGSSGAFSAASTPWIPPNTGNITIGSPGGVFSRFYYTTVDVDNNTALKYQNPPYPVLTLADYFTPAMKYLIPQQNILSIEDDRIVCSLPSDVPWGYHRFYVEDSVGTRPSAEVQIGQLIKVEYPLDMPFGPGTNSEIDLVNEFYIASKGWGGANGGVSGNHFYQDDGLLVLEAHGDLYSGDSQGFAEDGNPKKHDQPEDPFYDSPWTKRVGAALISKHYYGYGSYIVEAQLPREMGVAPTFSVSHYEKVRLKDPRYEELMSRGLLNQGSIENGCYVVAKNETGMELPSNNANCIFTSVEEMLSASYHAAWAGQLVAVSQDPDPENNGTWQLDNAAAPQLIGSWTRINSEIQRLYQPRKDNIRCNNWIGEIGEGNGLSIGANPYQDEYLSMLTNMGKDVWDGEFHEFRFDWYADRVEFYVDQELIQVNRSFVPDISGRFMIGLWFPSPPNPVNAWQVDPNKAWAGKAANWKYQKMLIKRIAHTPFTEEEAGGTTPLLGETYPSIGMQELYVRYVP